MAITQVSDVVVPEVFAGYIQQFTEEKNRLITSGAVVVDPVIVNFLQGGGNTFNLPSWQDLANTADNVSSDEAAGANDSTADNTTTSQEVGVRLHRNKSWSTSNLAGDLAGSDPMGSIVSRVGKYWLRRQQEILKSTLIGVFADNDANDSGDMTNDISGGGFVDGVTNFNTAGFIDAKLTMGDSSDDLGIIFVHSIVHATMEKNDLIDFLPDSEGMPVATYRGFQVIVDDGMPNTGGVFDSWLLGPGALRWGQVPGNRGVAVQYEEQAGNGGGEELLYNRWQYCMHPTGFAYTGAATGGGPTNAVLDDAASWNRVYPERKQIKIARLVTRES